MKDFPLQELQKLFVQGYKNPHSNFYRQAYASRGFAPELPWPKNREDWERTPLISKEDLAAVKLGERLFLPQEELMSLNTTSGTTSRAVVLNPRSRPHGYGGGYGSIAKRLMYFRHPTGFVEAMLNGMAFVAGDLADIPGTARLAARFGVDAFETSVSQLSLLTEPLSQVMDLATIRLLVLVGERFSETGYAYVRSRYPNALIIPTYGGAETHGVHARACDALGRSSRNVVHFPAYVFPELIDPQTGRPVPQGEEGEIVQSVLWDPNIFPVIRFRTGDLARWIEPICDCRRDTYEILGRVEFDRLNIVGGLLTSEELERVLAVYQDSIHDDFELHVTDVISGGRTRPRFELKVRPKKSIDLKGLATEIPPKLKIGPKHTFAKGLADGTYDSFICNAFPRGEPPRAKQRRIIRH